MEKTFKERLDEEDKILVINEWVEKQINEDYKRKLKKDITNERKVELQELENEYKEYFDKLNNINIKYKDLFEKIEKEEFDELKKR